TVNTEDYNFGTPAGKYNTHSGVTASYYLHIFDSSGQSSAVTSDPRLVPTSDGHVQVFAINSGRVRQNWYSPTNGSTGNWVQAPGMGLQAVGNPAAVARTGQPVIDLFVRGSDSVIRETWYNWSNGGWGGYIAIAGSTFSGDPQAVATSDGHDQIFAN